jgi:hypothetical protein
VLTLWEEEALPPEVHLGRVNKLLRLKDPGLIAVHRLSTTPPLYQLVGAHGTSRLTTAQLAEGRYCRVKIADATRQVPGALPRGTWPKIWDALMKAAIERNVGPLGTEAGQVAEWVGEYLNARGEPAMKRTDSVYPRAPYWEGDVVCVFATDFLTFLRDALKERIDSKQLALVMDAADATHKTVGTSSGSTTTVYRLPSALHRLAKPSQ